MATLAHMVTATATEMPARLIESAFRLFSQKGFQRVNLDRIATEAGVTKGSLYWHFHSKHDLILASCNHYYRAFHRRMNDQVAPLRDPEQRLRAALRSTVRTCLLDEQNRIFTMEIWTAAAQDADLRASWRQFYDSVREFFIGLVKAASLAGQARVSDPEQAVNTMLAAMEGVKLRAMFEPEICCSTEGGRILAGLEKIVGLTPEDSST